MTPVRAVGDLALRYQPVSNPGGDPYAALILGTPGVQNYWPLTNASGSVTDPVSGNTGTPSAGVTLGQPGGFNGTTTASFNGTNGYITTANQVPAPSSGLSVEVWMKGTQVGGALISFNASQAPQSSVPSTPVMYLNSGGFICFGDWTTAMKICSDSVPATDGNWHHFVGTIDSSGTIQLYRDGAFKVQNIAAQVPATGPGYWLLGQGYLVGYTGATGQYYKNTLGQVAVYNTVLSAATILAHYQAGGH